MKCIDITSSMRVSDDYRRSRHRLVYLARRFLGDDARFSEDIVQDIFIEILESADLSYSVANLARAMLLRRCINAKIRERRSLLSDSEPGSQDMETWLEEREALEKATQVLNQDELNLLLKEWKQRPPSGAQIKIRLAKRKLAQVFQQDKK